MKTFERSYAIQLSAVLEVMKGAIYLRIAVLTSIITYLRFSTRQLAGLGPHLIGHLYQLWRSSDRCSRYNPAFFGDCRSFHDNDIQFFVGLVLGVEALLGSEPAS